MTERRERLDRILRSLDSEAEESPERDSRVLRERARALARPQEEPGESAHQIDVVRFRLGNERYAIEARYVLGIMRTIGVTPVPGLSEFFLGVTNLRGEILAVVDLPRFLGIERTEPSEPSRLIVLGAERPEFGILADETDEVTKLAETALHPPSVVTGSVRRAHLRGVTDDALIALDGAALLADPALFFDEGDDALPATRRSAD